MGGKHERSRQTRSVFFDFIVLHVPVRVYAQQQLIGAPPEASNMKLVGYNDLQARSAYQPTIHHQGDRWIAYIGHHGGTDEIPDAASIRMTGKAEPNGTSIVDVTDPAQSEISAAHSGPAGQIRSRRRADGARSATARLCRRAIAARSTCCARSAARRMRSGTSPIPPTRCWSRGIAGLKDTHKNWWECDTGIAYLVSGAPDWRTRRMTQVYDLCDPAHPVKIRDFGLPGQEPGATGAVPTELHGPISTGPQGNRVYFGYGTNKGGFLQIVDREKLLNGPKEPTPDNLRYPGDLAAADVGVQRRAHHVPDAGHADRRIRQGQGRQAAATSS